MAIGCIGLNTYIIIIIIIVVVVVIIIVYSWGRFIHSVHLGLLFGRKRR